MKKYTTVIFLLSIFSLAIQAKEAGFYDRKSEGWFWYKQDPIEEEIKEPIVPQPIIKEESVQNSTPFSTPFSSAWFRENLPKYKDIAWDNPTVENVKTFLYLQRFAMDRSEQFSDTAELAVTGDPFLDEITRRPVATFASQKIDREAGNAKNQLIYTIAERVGIFFFFNSNCEYCELQAPLVKILEQIGFSIIPISTDGKPLPSGLFPNYRKDNGHADQLGIISLPALYLVSPTGEFASIGQGTMSLPEMTQRILIAARRNNWVSDKEFNTTRPVLNLDNNIAEKLSTGLSPELLNKNGNEFIPPEILMEYIQNKLQEQ